MWTSVGVSMICFCFKFLVLFLCACKFVVFVILTNEWSWEFAEEKKQKKKRDVARRPTMKTESESIETFFVTLVSRKSYCVTSCETKDLLCYYCWVKNFKFVWNNHIGIGIGMYLVCFLTRGYSARNNNKSKIQQADKERKHAKKEGYGFPYDYYTIML